VSEIENDGVVPEEAAYGVGSSMPGDEHVADGRVGARTVGAEADVVVVIVRLPPPPQPTRTGGPCYRVAANLWFLLLRAAARPRDSRVSEPQPQHRRLLPATQETSLRPGAKGGHGDGGHRRRAAEGPRGPRAGWNLTSREARDQARSADFGRWGGSPATSKGLSSRSDFGERAGARRDGIHYGPNHPPLIFITTAIEGELYLPEEEIGTSIPSPPASSPSVGASSAVPAQAGRCSLAPGVAPLGHCVRRQPPLVWPGSPMVPSSASNRGEGEKEMPPAGLAPRACSRSGGESDLRGARGAPSWQLCSGARRAGRRCGSSSSSVAAWRVSPRGACGPRGLAGRAEEEPGHAGGEAGEPVVLFYRRGRMPSQSVAGQRAVDGGVLWNA